MNEEYLQALYDNLGGQESVGDYNKFKSLISENEDYAKTVYSNLGGEEAIGDYGKYSNLVMGGKEQGVQPAAATVTPEEEEDYTQESLSGSEEESTEQPQVLPNQPKESQTEQPKTMGEIARESVAEKDPKKESKRDFKIAETLDEKRLKLQEFGQTIAQERNTLAEMQDKVLQYKDVIESYENSLIEKQSVNPHAVNSSEIDSLNTMAAEYKSLAKEFNNRAAMLQGDVQRYKDTQEVIKLQERKQEEAIEEAREVPWNVLGNTQGLGLTLAKELYGSVMNMSERYFLAGAAGKAAQSLETTEYNEDIMNQNIEKIKAYDTSKEQKERLIETEKERLELWNKYGSKFNDFKLNIKRNLIEFANKRYESAEERTKALALTDRLDKIDDPLDALSYAVNAMGEMIPQMVLSRFTLGGGTYALTSGNMYVEAFNNKARQLMDEKGLSEKEAKEELLKDDGINDLAINTAGAIVAGLDFMGSSAVLGGVGKKTQQQFIKELIDSKAVTTPIKRVIAGTKTQGLEVTTEAAQEAIEAEGVSFATGGEFGEGAAQLEGKDYLEIMAKASIGVGGVQVYQAINKPNISSTDIAVAIDGDLEAKQFAFERIEAMVVNEELTKERGEKLKAEVENKVRNYKSLSKDIPKENMPQAMKLQDEWEVLEQRVNENKTALSGALKKKQREVQEKIEALQTTQSEETLEQTDGVQQDQPKPTDAETATVEEQSPSQESERVNVVEESEAGEVDYFTRNIDGKTTVYQKNKDGTARILPDDEATTILDRSLQQEEQVDDVVEEEVIEDDAETDAKTDATNEIDFAISDRTVKVPLDEIEVNESEDVDFETKGKTNKFTLEHGGNRLGTVEVTVNDDGNAEVSATMLRAGREEGGGRRSNTGKGIGTVAYQKLAQQLQDNYGLKLVSGKSRTDAAENLWQSFVRKGIAKVVGDPNSENRSDYTYEFVLEEQPTAENRQDRVNNEIDGIVQKVKGRNVGESTNPNKIAKAVADYVQGTKVYEELDDIGRENMYREAMQRIGVDMAKAPSAKKVLGLGQAPKKGFTTRQLLKMTEEQDKRGIREGEKRIKSKVDRFAENIRAALRELSTGVLTKNQLTQLIRAASGVRTEGQMKSFESKAEKIINDAEYANTLARRNAAARNRKKAIKGLRNIGAIKELKSSILSVLSTPTELIPNSALSLYEDVINDLSLAGKKWGNIERVEFKSKVEKLSGILATDAQKAVDLHNRIASLFDENISFEDNVSQLESDGNLSDSDLDLINRHSHLFSDDVKDSEDGSAEDYLDEFDAAKKTLPSDDKYVLNDDEKEAIKFARSISKDDFLGLSKGKARSLVRGLEMASSGFINHQLLQGITDIKSNRNVKALISAGKLKDIGFIDKFRAKMSTAFTNIFRKGRDKKSYQVERIRSAPIANLGQLFKSQSKAFKKTGLYRVLFRETASRFSSLRVDLRKGKKLLTKANELLSADNNVRFLQKAKIAAYQIQMEYNSNSDNREVNTAMSWLQATLDDENSIYDDEAKAMLKDELGKYVVDGEISADLIYESLSKKEVRALELINSLYQDIQGKAVMDAAYQGLAFTPRENYIHLPKATVNDDHIAKNISELVENFVNPSVKSKAAIARTGKVHAISFDPVENAYGSLRKTVTSYHMNPAIKEARSTFNSLNSNDATKDNREILKALEDVYGQILNSEFMYMSQNRIAIENAVKTIARGGYRAMLSGLVRGAIELTSNFSHVALFTPFEYIKGVTAMQSSGINKAIIDGVINAVPTTQADRLTGDADLNSNTVESNLIEKADTFSPEIPVSKLRGKAGRAVRPIKNLAEKIASFQDFLIGKPDTLVAKPQFIGSLMTNFKEITGKELDLIKLANDKKYYLDNKEAIDEATARADDDVFTSASTNNPFEGIPKNIDDRQASAIKKAYRYMDRFMTRFIVSEYYSTVKAIQNVEFPFISKSNGEMSQYKAMRLLTATAIRMSMYNYGMGVMRDVMLSLFGMDEDEDEEGENTNMQDFSREVLGVIANLALGRNLGNFAKIPINYGIEYLNKEFGEGVTRKGEYEFGDDIVFSKIDLQDRYSESPELDFLISNTGSYSPFLKATKRGSIAYRRMLSAKTEPTKEKYLNELYTRTPFEVIGSTGIIPLYRDIKPIYMQHVYETGQKIGAKNKKVNIKTPKSPFKSGMDSGFKDKGLDKGF